MLGLTTRLSFPGLRGGRTALRSGAGGVLARSLGLLLVIFLNFLLLLPLATLLVLFVELAAAVVESTVDLA